MNMNSKPTTPSAGNNAGETHFRLRLFVAGDEPNSRMARETLFRLREKYFQHNCDITVVDVLEDYQAALRHRVVVVPALIVEAPPPERVIVGSLSDEDKVLTALGLTRKGWRP